VRSIIVAKQAQLGFEVTTGYSSAEAWSTTSGGEFLAIGVRGAISGRRADLIVIDDPVKSQADAESKTQRDYVWEWFKADLMTRLRPGGRMVLIMTRWHRDDLGGQVLARGGSDWRVIRLPALAEHNDPLGRPEGAPLWPDWEDQALLAQKRGLIGERAWAALFQQNPHPAAGQIFVADRLEIVDIPSRDRIGPIVRAWDLAATGTTGKNDPDWTVGLKLGQETNGRYIILDIRRIRGSPREVEELVLATARLDGTDVIVGIPEDPGQAGKSQMAYLTRQLAGFSVVAARETGAKATRAMPVASQLEAGNVTAAYGDWNQGLVDELRDFPYGRKDDQVDALVRAFTTLANLRRPSRSINLPMFTR
jgi:predicted phage terminase large subunit-like protein